MKKILVLVIVFFTVKISIAQYVVTDSVRNSAEGQAQMMADLLIKKDFKAFVKYTHPKLIDSVGGEEKMVEILKKAFDGMEQEGYSMTNATIGKSSGFVIAGGELQCLIEQVIEMKVPKARMILKSTLVGISSNSGKSWTFIDTQGKNIAKLREVLPNLSTQLVIPEKEKATVIED